MAKPDDAPVSGFSKWKRALLFGVPLTSAAALFIAGIIFWGGFNTAMEATNTMPFCISCHEMRDNVYKEYSTTIHYQNRTGVRATCSDCHVPDPWVHKVVRKVQASNELLHKVLGSISTPEKFEAKRLTLAKNVWQSMKKTDSRECRNCHNFVSMAPEFQRPRARKQHLNAFETGQTCIDCHKGIAHKSVRDQLTEEELEELEKPNPAFKREVPEMYLASLKRIEEKEAMLAADEKQQEEAAAAAVEERIASAVAAALAAKVAELNAQSGSQSTTAGQTEASGGSGGPAGSGAAGDVSGDIDWSGVEAKTVTLFYPGQASFEWVQTGKDHGGARAFAKLGDRCANCHAKEAADMGAKIVSGEKAEATPIPGKRGHVDVQVQAVHDADNLYMRFEWADADHTPAPFVDGGKMDPDNQVKLAMMIAGPGIDMIDQAGCWATCHHDSRYMPDHPEAAAITEAGDAVSAIDVADGITKYLADSRSKVEIAGRRNKKRGGWDKLKPAEEIDALLKAGSVMDLLRFRSGGDAENGHVLSQRVMGDAGEVVAAGSLDGGKWTVVMRRPLAATNPGDVPLELGGLYTVGFALHDDFTNARFHHVSLEFKLGLDSAEAEINAVAK
jgi:cytochrome c-type protein NapC